MTRLQHTHEGYRRLMQMSGTALFIFVEGLSDRYVYSRFANAECGGCDVEYRVVPAEEIRGNGGGKNVLLNFFDYLKQKKSLSDTFKGLTTYSAFFLDKDIDDILGLRRRSKHVIYTEHYDIEAYYFIHGDICTAVATSASLDVASVQSRIGNYGLWRQQAATCWKEWVKLCVLSRVCANGSMSYYGRPVSPIHAGPYGPLSSSSYKDYLKRLEVGSGLPPAEFQARFSRLSRRIDRLFSRGGHNRVFKGGWYIPFLIEDIKAIAGTRRYNHRGLESRLLSTLVSTMNFDGVWAERFREPIRSLVAKSNSSSK